MKIARILFFNLFLLLMCLPVQADESTSDRVIIVMDASGSMWGQIDGIPKINIARQVINNLLKDWTSDMELGLVAYGHRNKKDCKDIEVLVPVGANTHKAILEAVNSLTPKGKTPLSNAVHIAAQTLKYTENRATVILVSDGEETCDTDPCLLGKKLEETGVDFTTHVIGFDIKKTKEAGLVCLAKNTGGTYLKAKDAGSLKLAFEKTVTQIKEKAKEPVPVLQGTKLIALIKENSDQYKGDINWFILTDQKDLSGKRKVIQKKHRGLSGHIFKQLQPGKYHVVVELSDNRHIRRGFDIEVIEGENNIHKLTLNIGKVKFDVRVNQSAKPFSMDLGWKVLATKVDFSGKRAVTAEFWRKKSGQVFVLPAGTWRVNGVLADAKYITTTKEITLAPGGEDLHEFIIDAGWVRFNGKPSESSPAFKKDLAFKIWSANADFSGKHKLVTDFWRKKSGLIAILPAGNWLVTSTLPDYKHITAKKQISLAPSQELPIEFVYDTAWVKVNTTVNGQPFNGQIAWYAFEADADLSGKHKKIAEAWRVKSGNITLLKSGEYLIKALVPDDKGIKGETVIKVSPGDEQTITIDMKNT